MLFCRGIAVPKCGGLWQTLDRTDGPKACDMPAGPWPVRVAAKGSAQKVVQVQGAARAMQAPDPDVRQEIPLRQHSRLPRYPKLKKACGAAANLPHSVTVSAFTLWTTGRVLSSLRLRVFVPPHRVEFPASATLECFLYLQKLADAVWDPSRNAHCAASRSAFALTR